ncbi:hypothetical protein OGATHE_003791 [Ogataea polymorpha]|uniref:Uncharacterized protein n=1 Tax=Ogataea polymorpha TaxID=460523 RepID=A0A9P8P4P1_9ASCO|nr:hypothetical protein OGATHE_003791 [Ogataea polymorpha]
MERVRRLNNRWFDKVALGRVGKAAAQQLELGVVLDGVDRRAQLVERVFVDHRAHELVQAVGGRGVGGHDLVGMFHELFFELWPDLSVYIQTRGCRAFLALVLECAANRRQNSVAHIGRLIHQMEVLATCLSDNPWEVSVFALGGVVGDFSPNVAKNLRRAGEMQSVEIFV